MSEVTLTLGIATPPLAFRFLRELRAIGRVRVRGSAARPPGASRCYVQAQARCAIGVGMAIAGHPLHGSRRTELPYRALASRQTVTGVAHLPPGHRTHPRAATQ